MEELQVSFQNLSAIQKTQLLTFLQTSAGLEIGLKDQDNRQWKGVIITPTNSVSQTGPGDCNLQTAFTFRGTLQ